jgi:mono/diheme cytochrome c family protein
VKFLQQTIWPWGVFMTMTILIIPNTGFSSSLTGQQVYLQACLVCHGDDGTGGMPGVPDLSGNKALFEDQERLLSRMKQGISTPGAPVTMPPNGGNPDLTEDQIKAALDYLRAILSQ